MALLDPLDGPRTASYQPWPEIPIPPHVLKGTAEAAHYRETDDELDKRWYVDPLPADDRWQETQAEFPAVSTIKKASGNDWSLVALKRCAEEIARNPERFIGMDMTDIYETLKADDKRGLRRAAARGTNVHTYFEMGLRGFPITYADNEHEAGAEYLPAVRQFFRAYKPRLIATEYVGIHRDLNGVGYGGTGDCIAEITNNKGQRVIAAIDWKSRKDEGTHKAYPQEAQQLGANTRAQYMMVEGPLGPQRMEIPRCDLGIIVSIRPDGPRLYPIDLDKAWVKFQDLHRWWVSRKGERDPIGRQWRPLPVPTLLEQARETTSRGEAMALWRAHRFDPEWTPEVDRVLKELHPR